jgi:hypothetical protein
MAATVVLPIVLLAVLAVVIIHVRLQHGPVSLKMFAAPIAAGINAELGDLSATIGDVEARLSSEGRLEFRLKNVSIREADGDAVASAPMAAVEISRSALWSLRIVPERIYLIEPRLSLYYSREQGLSLSFSDTARVEGEQAEAGQALVKARSDSGEQRPDEERTVESDAAGPLRHAPLKGQIKRAPAAMPASLRRLDLARLLARSSARARRGEDATSYLREVGLRNATLALDYGGKQTEWKVTEFSVDLEHMKKRSIISGHARIASGRGPWSLSFRTEDSEKTQSVSLKASVRDLVPSALGQSLPDLSLLQMLDLPIAGDASIKLTTSGVLNGATMAVELGHGAIRLPGVASEPITIDAGLLHLDYDAEQRRLTLAPSTITWGDSRLTLAGGMAAAASSGGELEWGWNLKVTDGVLAAGDLGVAAIPVEEGVAEGRIVPHRGELELAALRVRAGGAGITLAGRMDTLGAEPSLDLEGQSTPMPIAILKAMWPRAFAPAAREWIGRRVSKANLGAGRLRVATGRFMEGEPASSGGPARSVSFALEAADLAIAASEKGGLVEAQRALFRLENDTAELAMPDAALVAPSGKKLPLKGARFLATGLGSPAPQGEFSVRSQGSLQPALEIALSHLAALPAEVAPVLQSLDGKVDAQFSARMPLIAGADLKTVSLSAKAKLGDLRAKAKIGPLELQGGTVEVDATQVGVQVTGDLLLNGVIAKLKWKRAFTSETAEAEPLEIRATLDNADRTQIGLDINHLVQGEVPLVVTVVNEGPQPKIRVKGDLGNAEIGLRDLAWKKPRGQAASVEFDVAKSSTAGYIELQNFKVIGDNVAIEGWLSVDDENEVREFYFPDFSMNVVSRLEVQGRLGTNKVWNIKAKGATFDGRDFFRQLTSLGGNDENRIRPLRPAAGIDIEADIGTVIGHSEVSLRGFRLRMQERADKLAALDAEGTLDGGKPLSFVMKRDPDQARIMSGVTTDAGQAFKLVGFYRSIEKGRAQIEVNLDAKGVAERSGLLWIEDFRVLGDPIIAEVVANTPDAGPGAGPKGQRKVVREQVEFSRLFARFSTGHAQLVLEDAAVKGPILGATIRGRIDYGTQRLNLGGTYVPLQGINAAFCNIPVVGQIITGTSCEGLLGLTYAIQGPIAEPQVIINPFSMVAPGIFREIFTMTNPNPKILPRGDAKPVQPLTERVGSSASPVARGDGGQGAGARTQAADTIDGWSMETGGKKN